MVELISLIDDGSRYRFFGTMRFNTCWSSSVNFLGQPEFFTVAWKFFCCLKNSCIFFDSVAIETLNSSATIVIEAPVMRKPIFASLCEF